MILEISKTTVKISNNEVETGINSIHCDRLNSLISLNEKQFQQKSNF